MQLIVALAIIASVLVPDSKFELDLLWLRMGCCLALLAIPAVFAARYSRLIETEVSTDIFVQSLVRFERLFLLTWCTAVSFAFFLFDWVPCAFSTPWISSSAFLIRSLVACPILASVVFYWWMIACLESKHLLTESNRRPPEPWRENLRIVWIQIRQIMLLPMTPVFVILLIDDLLKLYPAAAEYRAVVFGAIVASLPFILPSILRSLWDLESLCGEKRHRVLAVADRMRVHVADVCLWKTGNRSLNAAVAGAFRRTRILLLSDALVDSFNDTDLEAVVAHEMAHVKHRHIVTMLLTLVSAGLTAVLCMQILDRQEIHPSTNASLLVLIPVIAIWLLLHRFIARSFEHQADVEACLQLTTTIATKPPAANSQTDSAVFTFVEMLRKLAPNGTTGSDWWHPSIDTRIATLKEIHQDDTVREEFEGRIQAINRLVHGSVVFLLLVTTGLGLLGI
ncbi:MAG: M48 family metalloprotease [Planctomycetales bacterium]|nr:M48 family metalloprotease [Planctomycetales bacterium]